MKGANTDIEIIFNGFSKKMKFEAIVSFKTQNVTSTQLWIHCKNCVTMLHNERGKERHGNYIRGFSEKKKEKKKKNGAIWSFLPKVVCPHNFASA